MVRVVGTVVVALCSVLLCATSAHAGYGYVTSFHPAPTAPLVGPFNNRVMFGLGTAALSNPIYFPFQFQFFGFSVSPLRVSPNGYVYRMFVVHAVARDA
jgi:hypothetical protein